MRKILFRGKDIYTGKWHYGDLRHNGDKLYIESAGVIHAVQSDTVGEYCGLHDKNGIDIYEGDIMKWQYYGIDKVGVVYWDPSGIFIGRPQGNSIACLGVAATILGAEVIGNIYDNPELLKGGSHD